MIIYRCDKCGKEVPNNTDLYRIRAISEWYDDSEGMHYWKESAKTKYFDVCEKCKENLLWLFVKQFDCEEGAEQEQKSEWEHDQEILKAHSEGAREILDIIRAEIVDLGQRTMNDNRASGIWACRDIIDKYKEGVEE